jgi:hypothetical protein
MPLPQPRRPIAWWRLGLLLTLGGTILFASFSYDDWRLIGRYLGSEVWQVAARRRAMSRDLREQQERAARERREAHVDGSIRGLFAGPAQALARCPDGGLVVGGMHSRHGLALARLDADGTLDRAWTDRMAAQSIVGGVGAVSCDEAGLLVSGSLLAHRNLPGQVVAARFAPDGTLAHVYGVNDVSWLDRSRSDRIALDLRERVGRQLPPRSNLRAVFGGPGASAIAFFDDRLPEPEEPSDSWTTLVDVTGTTPRRRRVRMPNIYLCGVGEESRARWVSRAAVFDEAGALSGTPEAAARPDGHVAEAQPGRGWIVRVTEPTTPEAAVVWRLTAAGLDPTFQELRARDLGGPGPALVLASLVEPDGRIVLAGTFESVRGQPRRHIARLRADGTLDE